jgi:pimeloyl-ACP methyl ester carboxylesterase
MRLKRPSAHGSTAQGNLVRALSSAASAPRPVLLVHGLGGSESSWSAVARTLSSRGRIVDTITYAPFGTSVEQVADQLAARVERILSETGSDKVHLVGHSLGGVVIAEAIATGRIDGRVDTVVTLGSPFGGSPWAHLLPFGEIVPALRQGSPLLRRLACAPVPDDIRWLAFTGAFDMVVPSIRAVPAHPRVETETIHGVGHLALLSSQHAVGRIADALPA